jgi:hypothetical protein
VAEATAAFATKNVVLVTGAVGGEALTLAAVPSGKTLYVGNTLTLAAAPTATGAIVALGKVGFSADANLASIVATAPADGKLVIAQATLTNSAAVNVTLPAAVAVKAINAGSGAAKLTIAGATNLTVAGDLTGDLALTAAVTAVTIGGGTGNIEFNTGTPAFASSASTFGNTGTTTFKEAAGSTSVPLTFAGPVAFEGDFTRTTGGAYSFGGDVTVTSTKALTLGGTDTVTLAATKSIKVGTSAVLTAGVDAVLTPVTGATLTAATNKLTLGAANLTLTSGALTVATGATLTLDKVLTVAAGAELVATGDVTVTASTGGLVLTGAAGSGGAKLSGAGNVTAGATEITGIWQAVDGTGSATITIEASSAVASSITASDSNVVLTAGTGGTITQTAESGNKLTIAADTTIDLGGTAAAVGSLVLTGDGTNPGEIELAHASSSIVKTGNTVGASAFGSAAKIGAKTFAAGTSGSADIYTTADNGAGKLAQILGGTTDYGLKGGNASNTITIDSTQEVTT